MAAYTENLLFELEQARKRGYLLLKDNKNSLTFTVDRHASWCRKEKQPFGLIKVRKEEATLVYDLMYTQYAFSRKILPDLYELFSLYPCAYKEKECLLSHMVTPLFLQHPSIALEDCEQLMQTIQCWYGMGENVVENG